MHGRANGEHMSKSSLIYNKDFTEKFEKQLRKLGDKVRVKRINQKVDEILSFPYREIRFGAGRWRGKREERIGDDRLFFAICEQCRKEKHQAYNNCYNCEKIPDNTIRFFEMVDSHKYNER
jgi:mRNA-degrading endonuclease RelE of RelBE toxin-antitoxin system